MRLILVRHGETFENRACICQSQDGCHLTSKGVKQAEKLAKALEKEKIDIIFSSPSTRTKETARELLKIRDIPIKYDRNIIERDMGCLTGKTRELYKEEMKKSKLPRHIFKPKKGESYEDLQKRAATFLKKIQKSGKKNILVVTHGGTIRVLLCLMLNISLAKAFYIKQDNACINIVEEKRGKFKAIRINYTRHLRGLK